ncbi:MAG: hypothetical protein B7Y09_22425 [Polaromonas sp. 24-63-21]|nr:MAG: hypothetical protein B7Y09_22425 [Polaromonas sp. 24-63-21]
MEVAEMSPGQKAYASYSLAVAGKTYDGMPLLDWWQLNAATKAGWAAAENTPAVKPWWKSKTLWVNAVVLALAAAESQLNVLQGALPGGLFTWLAFGLPVANAALRFITSTAVGKS